MQQRCPKCGTIYEGNFCPRGCNSPNYQKPKKKGLKILLIIVATILTVAVLGGVLGELTSQSDASNGSSQQTTVSDTNSSEKEDTEKAIYTDSNVKVSFIKVEDGADLGVTACYIYLKVENISKQTFTVSLIDAYANDSAVTVMSGLPMTLAPGKNSKQPFMFGYNNILTSADEIEKLEFKITLLDENFSLISTSKNITVKVK